jgi:hypothetical protein
VVEGVLAASATTAAALAPAATGRAEDSSYGGGVFIGYNVGTRPGMEWGFEIFATRLLTGNGECDNDERSGAGGMAQIALLGFGQPRFTLAGHGGGELSRGLGAVTGELGATYRTGPRPGFGIHMGVLPEVMFLNGAVRHQWLLNDTWFGGGARILPTYGAPGFCSVGRPLRTECGFAQVGPAARVDEECGPAARGEECIVDVGRAYERDAQLEHASVPAFLQLAAELAAQRAPATLVQRALAAARDEVRHAEQCASLAARHLRQRISPVLPEIAPRALLAGTAGILRLAIESWLDGCLAEGTAAAQAARAASLSQDRAAHALQRGVADDEHRHAELAWSILGWTLGRGGDDVRDALRAVRDAESAPAAEPAPDGLEHHGRLGQHALVEVDREHRRASRQRLDALIG